jgi:hypothetical protein
VVVPAGTGAVGTAYCRHCIFRPVGRCYRHHQGNTAVPSKTPKTAFKDAWKPLKLFNTPPWVYRLPRLRTHTRSMHTAGQQMASLECGWGGMQAGDMNCSLAVETSQCTHKHSACTNTKRHWHPWWHARRHAQMMCSKEIKVTWFTRHLLQYFAAHNHSH